MGRVVGIDLGTTYSAVAVLGDDGLPEIVQNSDGESTTPSVVLFQSFDGVDEPLVGTMAKHSAASDPDNVVQFVKRNIGDPNWRFDSASGVSYTAEEVSALILKKLKQDAERALSEEIDGAVITVPAYFDDARRTATKHAGAIAGLNVLRVLNEPTAAALSFGLDAGRDGVALVYDLGGGTFDVTLLRIEGTKFEVIGTDGDRNLGGFDFDNELMQLVRDDLVKQGAGDVLSDFMLSSELREKCETAKRALSNVEKTSVHMSVGGRPYRVTVTRTAFESATSSLLRRTRELVEDLLDETGYGWDRIDQVVLVGGSTRMPMVRELVAEMSGKSFARGVNPDEAVALGAAVQAAMEVEAHPELIGFEAATSDLPAVVSGIEVSDVTSQALGVVMLNDEGKDYNQVVIPRNAPVPSEYSQEGGTVVENQRTINVRVTQGDDPDLDFVVIIGSREIPLPEGLPRGAPLRITYRYDSEQTVHVGLYDMTGCRPLGEFALERVANMSQRDLDAAITKIRGIDVE